MTRGQPSPPLLTPSGGRVPPCPWGSYRPSQVGGTAPSPAGGRAPLGPGGRGSPSGRGACASAAPSRTGPSPAWRRRRCAASSTRMAWRCATPAARAGVPHRAAARAGRLTAGWSGANGVACCPRGGGEWRGRGPPPRSRRTPGRGAGGPGPRACASGARPLARPPRGIPPSAHGVRAVRGRTTGVWQRGARGGR